MPQSVQIRLHRQLVVAVNGGAVDPIILDLAATISKRDRTQVAVVYVVEVGQQLPVDADLPEELERGERVLDRGGDDRAGTRLARDVRCAAGAIGRRGDRGRGRAARRGLDRPRRGVARKVRRADLWLNRAVCDDARDVRGLGLPRAAERAADWRVSAAREEGSGKRRCRIHGTGATAARQISSSSAAVASGRASRR